MKILLKVLSLTLLSFTTLGQDIDDLQKQIIGNFDPLKMFSTILKQSFLTSLQNRGVVLANNQTAFMTVFSNQLVDFIVADQEIVSVMFSSDGMGSSGSVFNKINNYVTNMSSYQSFMMIFLRKYFPSTFLQSLSSTQQLKAINITVKYITLQYVFRQKVLANQTIRSMFLDLFTNDITFKQSLLQFKIAKLDTKLSGYIKNLIITNSLFSTYNVSSLTTAQLQNVYQLLISDQSQDATILISTS